MLQGVSPWFHPLSEVFSDPVLVRHNHEELSLIVIVVEAQEAPRRVEPLHCLVVQPSFHLGTKIKLPIRSITQMAEKQDTATICSGATTGFQSHAEPKHSS